MDIGDVTEEFQCSVCFHIATQPTTLSCGHTSCRVCLAQWYFTSKKKECPLCRELYHGHPKINTQLRNLLMRLAPEDMKNREKEMTDDREGMRIVAKYDTELQKDNKDNKKNDFTSFCIGIVVALCCFIVIYLAWYWQNHDKDLLIKKPVQTWKTKDVENWLKEMPWAQHFASVAMEQDIDGKFLLSLEEDSVQRLLNVTSEDQLKALMFSINMLKDQGIKMPVTLWDYKAIYPGRCLFLLYGMRNFPRTAVIYMWYYFYDELFVPFVCATTYFDDSSVDLLGNSTTTVLTAAMVSEFVFYVIFVPEYPVILFALQMFQHHMYTPVYILLTAIICMISNTLFWKECFFDRKWRLFFTMIEMHCKQLTYAFGFMILWPLIPRFVVDVVFYGTLYVSPVQLIFQLYNKVRHHRQ